MEEIQKLIAHLRLMQLFYHNAHNLCFGPVFFADHSAFSDFYGELEGCYDSAAERGIGLFGKQTLDMMKIIPYVQEKLFKLPSFNAGVSKEFFQAGLNLESELYMLLESLIKSNKYTQGTINLFADMADKCEVRKYKIKQRLG